MGAERFAPLTGVLAVVLIFAGIGVGGNPPNGSSSATKVVAYYGTHTTSQTTSGVLLSLGGLLFVIFAAVFVSRLRHVGDGAFGASGLCLVGAGLLVAGLAVLAGLSIAIADVVSHVDGSALQALNVLANDAVFVFLITIGTSAFLLGAAVAVLTKAVLPRWLGWFALVFAVVGAIPSHVLGGTLDHIGFAAFAGLGLWTLVAGVLLTARARAA